MRRRALVSLLTACMCVCFPFVSSAVTGLSLGVRGGTADYSGDVLPGSGDIGNGTMFGVHLRAGTLPIIDLELAAEYFEKDFTYTLPIAGNVDLTFRDVAVRATVKYNVFAPALSPLAVYVGAGAGMDMLNTAYPSSLSPVDQDKEKLLEDSAKVSYHGLGGVRVKLPVVPFSIFAEGRYGFIKGDEETVKTVSIYGGLDLNLP